MSSRRLPFVITLVVLLVLALVAGNASARSSSQRSNAATPTVGASGVWFCPGLPASLQHGLGRVTVANLSTTNAAVTVTDLSDAGNATTVTFSVAARTTVTKARDTLGAPGALTIEAFGGSVVVEEGIDGRAAGASAPCATATQSRQFFAAGSTLRGIHQSVIVENPYASDAKINLTLRTNVGVQQPDAFQGYDISRRSRVVIPVDTLAVRDARVAVEVDAVSGSVVATQTLEYTADAGVTGVTVALGAPAPSDHWTFPGNVVLAHTNAWVALTNVGTQDALVDVQAAPDQKQTVAPAALTIAPDAVTWVQLGHCGGQDANSCLAVPEGDGYVLTAHAEQGGQIVAQILTRGTDTRAPVGADAPMGLVDPSHRVAFAISRVRAEQSTTLSVFNPGSVRTTFTVTLVHDGRAERRSELQAVGLAPGREITMAVAGTGKHADAAVIVDADQPVFVLRAIHTSTNVARSGGIVLG